MFFGTGGRELGGPWRSPLCAPGRSWHFPSRSRSVDSWSRPRVGLRARAPRLRIFRSRVSFRTVLRHGMPLVPARTARARARPVSASAGGRRACSLSLMLPYPARWAAWGAGVPTVAFVESPSPPVVPAVCLRACSRSSRQPGPRALGSVGGAGVSLFSRARRNQPCPRGLLSIGGAAVRVLSSLPQPLAARAGRGGVWVRSFCRAHAAPAGRSCIRPAGVPSDFVHFVFITFQPAVARRCCYS